MICTKRHFATCSSIARSVGCAETDLGDTEGTLPVTGLADKAEPSSCLALADHKDMALFAVAAYAASLDMMVQEDELLAPLFRYPSVDEGG